jgi:hypothetical protein
MRDYPAYARTLAAHIRRGQKPIAVGVMLSSSWAYFDHVPKICIRPDEWRLGKYEFSYLAGTHVVAVPGLDCESPQLGELLLELMRVGPSLLWVFNIHGSKVYDDDFPVENWAFKLGNGRFDYRAAKVAADVMRAAQSRAARRWITEHERKRHRSEEEAMQFSLDSEMSAEAIKERVRTMFSSPWQAPDAELAA